jgi:hypothetical protein
MPSLHKPKRKPISLFVPSADHHPSGDAGSLYIMESVPKPEKISSKQLSDQFEALLCRKPSSGTYGIRWHCQPLLPPPFVREPHFDHLKYIISYGVVGFGSNIFISTLCNDSCLLDTANNTWTRVGKLALPFHGKLEYVPELNLWFGLSAEEGHFTAAAADVSTMDSSQPELVGEWKDFDPPAGWQEYNYPQLVNLGSGKLCIARFFQARSIGGGIDWIAVFTGVEVMQAVHDGNCSGSENGKAQV